MKFGATFTTWLNAPARERPPGGETVAELQARLLDWLTTVQAGTSIVFAHGGVLRSLLSWARGTTLDWSVPIPPAAALWLRLTEDRTPVGEPDFLAPQQAAS